MSISLGTAVYDSLAAQGHKIKAFFVLFVLSDYLP